MATTYHMVNKDSIQKEQYCLGCSGVDSYQTKGCIVIMRGRDVQMVVSEAKQSRFSTIPNLSEEGQLLGFLRDHAYSVKLQ